MPPTHEGLFVPEELGGVRRAPGYVSDHRMPGAADAEFIRDSVRLELTAEVTPGGVDAEVWITNDKVGHHIPTGHPARNMVLTVLATDGDGRPLRQLGGRRVPKWGGDEAGLPGKGYAKVLEDPWTGVWPTVAYWNPTVVRDDTRIPARATDVTRYLFAAPDGASRVVVTARLVFRRAFPELARWKGWTDPDIVVAERRVEPAR